MLLFSVLIETGNNEFGRGLVYIFSWCRKREWVRSLDILLLSTHCFKNYIELYPFLPIILTQPVQHNRAANPFLSCLSDYGNTFAYSLCCITPWYIWCHTWFFFLTHLIWDDKHNTLRWCVLTRLQMTKVQFIHHPVKGFIIRVLRVINEIVNF